MELKILPFRVDVSMPCLGCPPRRLLSLHVPRVICVAGIIVVYRYVRRMVLRALRLLRRFVLFVVRRTWRMVLMDYA